MVEKIPEYQPPMCAAFPAGVIPESPQPSAVEKSIDKLTGVVADVDMNVNDLLHETAQQTDAIDLLTRKTQLLLWLCIASIWTNAALILAAVLLK